MARLGREEAEIYRDQLVFLYEAYSRMKGWTFEYLNNDNDNNDNYEENDDDDYEEDVITVNPLLSSSTDEEKFWGVVLSVSGVEAYKNFQFESGIHRFFNKYNSKSQTSHLIVTVTPKTEHKESKSIIDLINKIYNKLYK